MVWCAAMPAMALDVSKVLDDSWRCGADALAQATDLVAQLQGPGDDAQLAESSGRIGCGFRLPFGNSLEDNHEVGHQISARNTANFTLRPQEFDTAI